ncbi:MAG: mannitol dehydrogenase [Candidatus Omnitrophica bacterium]|nr:mannitol dehydrogenase [Candidatus Omnitrophota bacterium]
MKKVMHFGAGNIGRGFFGQLYYESGYHIVFVDVVDEIVRTINQQKGYQIWIVGNEIEKVHIDNISCISLSNHKDVIEESKEINLFSISVGVNNVKNLVPVIAEIIKTKAVSKKDSFMNIIIGENMKNASEILGRQLIQFFSPEERDFFEKKVGLVETVLGRMIPIVSEQLKKQHSLIVLVEPYKTMPVAKRMFKGELPDVNGFLFVDDIEPYEAMKLYIHNFTHAAFAYAGYQKNYTFIWEAVADEKIKNTVEKAYIEVQQAICKKYKMGIEQLDNYYNDLLERFSNKKLGDTVVRVGREPIRKLGFEDRIIGAARLCHEMNIKPEYICFFAACCLHYNQIHDDESQKLQNLLKTYGIDYVIENICGLQMSHEIAQLIKSNYINFWKLLKKML